jgi:hypothetical protein
MKKGIVMDIDGKILTLLTPDGQFLRVKKQKRTCVIGEEITFTPVTKLNRLFGIKQLSAAAAFFILLLGSLLPLYNNNQAYAYMSIDASPSIELGINKKMQVVKFTPFNSEGKKIAAKIGDWEKKNITSISQTIIKEMKKQGYLKKNAVVIISAVRAETPEEKTEKQLTENIKEIKQMVKEINVKPVVINGTEKDMEKAHQEGITTGKYRGKMLHSKNDITPKPTVKKEDEIGKEDIQSVSGTDSSEAAENGNPNLPVENSGQTSNAPVSSENHTPPVQQKKIDEPSQEVKKEEKNYPHSNNGQIKKQEKNQGGGHPEK